MDPATHGRVLPWWTLTVIRSFIKVKFRVISVFKELLDYWTLLAKFFSLPPHTFSLIASIFQWPAFWSQQPMLEVQYLCLALQSEATLLPASHVHLVVGTEIIEMVITFSHEKMLFFFFKDMEIPKIFIKKFHCNASPLATLCLYSVSAFRTSSNIFPSSQESTLWKQGQMRAWPIQKNRGIKGGKCV